MKNIKYIRIIPFLIFFLLLGTYVEAKDVRVRGYYRKDGTYVRPHSRSAPDGNPYNNYSFPGNYNPYTGKVAPGNAETYLEKYKKDKYGPPSLPSDETVTPQSYQFNHKLTPPKPNVEDASVSTLSTQEKTQEDEEVMRLYGEALGELKELDQDESIRTAEPEPAVKSFSASSLSTRQIDKKVYALQKGQKARFFHRKDCPEISGNTEFIDFSDRTEALNGRGIPCPHCKP